MTLREWLGGRVVCRCRRIWFRVPARGFDDVGDRAGQGAADLEADAADHDGTGVADPRQPVPSFLRRQDSATFMDAASNGRVGSRRAFHR